jgi:hypothetical protein
VSAAPATPVQAKCTGTDEPDTTEKPSSWHDGGGFTEIVTVAGSELAFSLDRAVRMTTARFRRPSCNSSGVLT